MRVLSFLFAALTVAATAGAQVNPVPQLPATPREAPPLPATICNQQVPEPARLPPTTTGPVLTAVMLCFEKQGGSPVVEANTYLYYMQAKGSRPSLNEWIKFDDSVQQVALADFKRLWATNFLDDLAIEVRDVKYANGVVGKVLVYNMEERQRVKIVDYVGTEKVDTSKIEEALKNKSISIRLDSFIDPGLIRRVSGVVHEVYAEKGVRIRRGETRDQADRGWAEACERHVSHYRRTQGQDPSGRFRRQFKNQGQQACQADEGEQRRGNVLVHSGERYIQGRQV
jgi:hypothetical protein